MANLLSCTVDGDGFFDEKCAVIEQTNVAMKITNALGLRPRAGVAYTGEHNEAEDANRTAHKSKPHWLISILKVNSLIRADRVAMRPFG